MPEYPKLHVDEPTPPASLPFPGDDCAQSVPGRTDDRRDCPDAGRDAEDAIANAQRAIDELNRMADELDALPFIDPAHANDDGPWAA